MISTEKQPRDPEEHKNRRRASGLRTSGHRKWLCTCSKLSDGKFDKGLIRVVNVLKEVKLMKKLKLAKAFSPVRLGRNNGDDQQNGWKTRIDDEEWAKEDPVRTLGRGTREKLMALIRDTDLFWKMMSSLTRPPS
ncbi:hypothetical protein JTB14_002198 [Gonioctena quinquepunctata]|nr:hypothetical protein JTB14_002198 [Gonioctena quinquepunctata]